MASDMLGDTLPDDADAPVVRVASAPVVFDPTRATDNEFGNTSQFIARSGKWICLSVLGFLPVLMGLGIRQWGVVGAMLGCLAIAVVLSAYVSRQPRQQSGLVLAAMPISSIVESRQRRASSCRTRPDVRPTRRSARAGDGWRPT